MLIGIILVVQPLQLQCILTLLFSQSISKAAHYPSRTSDRIKSMFTSLSVYGLIIWYRRYQLRVFGYNYRDGMLYITEAVTVNDHDFTGFASGVDIPYVI
jgi:hypothetical protein